ncbi:hypothetical protein OF83DRAFT_1170035 [Amylostereum chailletii]|nr:hypothetical protein OF83DRAFT_1170035 [Amylostereum chailletii]
MSPPHAYTLAFSSFDEDEDVGDFDICPICEGECTCNNTSSTPVPPPQPLIRSSSSHPAPSPHFPPRSSTFAPLKIKLTVPPNLLAKARLQSSAQASASSSRRPKPDPHRRPRPPKTVVLPRTAAHADAISHSKTHKVAVIKSKGKDTTGKPPKRKVAPGSDDEYHPAGSGPSTLRRGPVQQNNHLDDGEDEEENGAIDEPRPIHFPTFLSAVSSSSADDSSESSSSSEEESDLTDFSDSSIEEEEEFFIQTDEQRQRSHAHDKARVKRELLGENGMKWKDRRNTWDIRPRKKSVGPDDDDMDVDSDDTEDDGEEGDEEEGGIADDDDEDLDGEDDEHPRRMYAGIATGWSEDEDSFDAELFFAGLSDSESGAEQCGEPNGDATADEDDLDEDDNMLDAALLAAQGIFEITESWDGSVVFTNGLQDGQGLLNWDFGDSATQLDDASSSDDGGDTDVQMSDEMDGDQSDDDGLQEVESNDGNTTEEELVDEKGLPTDRAMRLFRPPTTPLPSVNPLSTMSAVIRTSPTSGQTKPWSIEEEEEEGSPGCPVSKVGPRPKGFAGERIKPRLPNMGTFEASQSDLLRRAVIDGSRPQDLPSPFPPKARKRRASESISSRSISRSRDRSLSLSQNFALSPSPLGTLLPSLLAAEDPTPVSSGLPLAEPIRLDDVLDASMLDSDPFDAPPDTELSSCDMHDDDGGRLLQNLSRWDRVPMNAFRRTRESGLMSDSATEYGHLIRSSPFSGTLWTRDEDTDHIPSPTATSKSKKGRKGKGRMDVMISPVLLPVRDRDGDRTPTGFNTYTPPSKGGQSRKETRHEKMLKRKGMMGAAPGKRHQQHFHHHGHHPNAKAGRTGGSAQRGFFGGSVPPLSL